MIANIIMLYGVPKGQSPERDPNYRAYFKSVLAHAHGHARGDPEQEFFVGGGATDPSRRVTEAYVGMLVLLSLGADVRKVHSVPHGLDAREVLEAIERRVPSDARVRVYCAYTHQDLVKFLVSRIFPWEVVEVVPLPFPATQGRLKGRVLRALRWPRTLLGIAAWHSRALRDFVEIPLRARHMRECASSLATPPASHRKS